MSSPPHTSCFDPDENDPAEMFDHSFPHSRRPFSHSTKPHALIICPKCQSSHVEARHVGRRIGGALGTLAGATSAFAVAMAGARTGTVVNAFAVPPPVGSMAGAISSAIVASLAGAAAGGSAGVTIGTLVDDNILNSHICHDCKYTFSPNTK